MNTSMKLRSFHTRSPRSIFVSCTIIAASSGVNDGYRPSSLAARQHAIEPQPLR